MQESRGKQPAKLVFDQQTDQYFDPRISQFKQNEPRYKTDRKGYTTTSTRKASRLCKCAACDRKTLDVLAEEERVAAAEARRANKEGKARKIRPLSEWTNILTPTAFLSDALVGIMCVLTAMYNDMPLLLTSRFSPGRLVLQMRPAGMRRIQVSCVHRRR